MRFEGREQPSYAEPVTPAELREGGVYFAVSFVDREMLIPTMEAVVFIGRNLQSGDFGKVYFQDIESYRRGVRYETATDDDYAQFSVGSEEEVGHIFEFERALERLMGCAIRRKEAGTDLILRQPARGFQRVEQPSQIALEESRTRSLRFENADLQALFIAGLRKAGVSFAMRADGAATSEHTDWQTFSSVANAIRDSCFRWYFSMWNDQGPALRFWEEMKEAGLPFEVEHHDDRIVFLLPRGSEDLHETVSARVLDPEPGESGRSTDGPT
jgi:hypothetical protein